MDKQVEVLDFEKELGVLLDKHEQLISTRHKHWKDKMAAMLDMQKSVQEFVDRFKKKG